MGILPDKILDESIISDFIDNINETSKEIIDDDKFSIPNPNLPGLGMLIKLETRVLEKSLASSFAPIFIGKNVLSKGLPEIKESLKSIKTIFSNPLQFLVDEGINSTLSDFPFPVSVVVNSTGGSTDDIRKLQTLIADASSDSIESKLENYDYDISFSSEDIPIEGIITTPDANSSSIKTLRVNNTTKTASVNTSLLLLGIGDEAMINVEGGSTSFVITNVSDYEGFKELSVEITNVTNAQESSEVKIPGFSNTTLSNDRKILLRGFTDENGGIIIPFSALGLVFPLSSLLSLNIGDFSTVSASSPTGAFIENLGNIGGLNPNQVFSGILAGKFPILDFKKLQDSKAAGNIDATEKAKEDLIGFGRLLQIAADNPFFLIRILLNYFRMLLLPVVIIKGVISGLAKKITNPVSLIRTVINGISNPLKLLCGLIAEGFLSFLSPFISPMITPIMSYEDALNDPDDPSKGLQPLFSDLICGRFKSGLSTYEPSQSFFAEQRNSLPTASGKTDLSIDLPYFISLSTSSPLEGELDEDALNDPDDPSKGLQPLFSDLICGRFKSGLSTYEPSQSFFAEQRNSLPTASGKTDLSIDLPYFISLSTSSPLEGELVIEYGDSDIIEYIKISSITNTVEDSTILISSLNIGSKISLTINGELGIFTITSKERIDADVPYYILGVLSDPSYLENNSTDMLYGDITQNSEKLSAVLSTENPNLTVLYIMEKYLPVKLIGIWESIKGLIAVTASIAIEIPSLLPSIIASLFGKKSSDIAIEGVSESIGLMYGGYSSLSFLGSNGSGSEESELWNAINQNSDSSTEEGIEDFFKVIGSDRLSNGDSDIILKDNLSVQDPGFSTDNLLGYSTLSTPTRLLGKNDFRYSQYSLDSLGNSIKVLNSIMYSMKDIVYLDENSYSYVLNGNIKVYGTENGERSTIFDGVVIDGINKFKVSKEPISMITTPNNMRVFINREMDFINNYLLPSLIS